MHLPEFGSRLKYLVFEPLDEYLGVQIKAEIKEAINRWEDRIEVIDVEVSFPEDTDMDNQERVSAVVRYILRPEKKSIRDFRITL